MSDVNAKADRITVMVGVTRNLGDYNNVKLDASWETSVLSGEDVEATFQRAWEKVEKQVEDKLGEYEV
jgi:hypothetical protein